MQEDGTESEEEGQEETHTRDPRDQAALALTCAPHPPPYTRILLMYLASPRRANTASVVMEPVPR